MHINICLPVAEEFEKHWPVSFHINIFLFLTSSAVMGKFGDQVVIWKDIFISKAVRHEDTARA